MKTPQQIIILTPLPFWHPGTKEYVHELKKKGWKVIALDIWNFLYYDENQNLYSFNPFFARGVIGRIYRYCFRITFLKSKINTGSIVDIHWCDYNYYRYIKILRSIKLKIVATFFGSDFYRMPMHAIEKMRKFLALVDKIMMGENMVDDFLKLYPEFSYKIGTMQYGSKRMEKLYEQKSIFNKENIRKKFNIPNGHLVISIGYNAKPEQQHFKILESIQKLDKNTKSKITLLFILTYGKDNKTYYEKLLATIRKLDIHTLCFTKFMNETELYELRILSDITVNFQTSDVLSSSIKEAFVADNVVITGEWLPYHIYKDIGVFFLQVSEHTLASVLYDVIHNFDLYHQQCEQNARIVYNFAKWDNVIQDFTSVYLQLYAKSE